MMKRTTLKSTCLELEEETNTVILTLECEDAGVANGLFDAIARGLERGVISINSGPPAEIVEQISEALQ